MSINRPSQMSECLYKVLWSYIKSSFKYNRSPPYFEQMWPWWISWYPGICSSDKSALALSHVSCRQMAQKNISTEDNLLMIAKKLSNFDLMLCILRLSTTHSFWLLRKADSISHTSMYRDSQKFIISSYKIEHYMIEIIFGANHIFKGIFVCYGIIRHIQNRL